MRIGIPRETKEGERRVALLPEDAAVLARGGHDVVVEAGAGAGIGLADATYRGAGARIGTAAEAWGAELVVKVKELQDADLANVRAASPVFSFQHLVGEPERTREVAALGLSLIAFELVRDAQGGFPLLAPMSEIAGRMAVEAAARLLGRRPAKVLVLGAGHAGLAAARTAAAMGATVTVLTRSAGSRDGARRQGHDAELAAPAVVERHALGADIVVGAVFVPAQRTPKLLPRALVARMKRGAVIADVSIDAGGVAETSRPTTHADPTFVAEGVIHYCVPNIPAASPPEAARAISGAVLPYVQRMAAAGVAAALRDDARLREAALLWNGRIRHPDLASEAGLPYTPLSPAELP